MVAYSFNKRFVAPICVGMDIEIPRWPDLRIAAGVEIRPKRQTIRAIGKRRHAQPGAKLQLYTGMRTKQCRKISDAVCVGSDPVTLRICGDGDLLVTVNRRLLPDGDRDQFVFDDGFGSVEDMWLFWRKEHPGFEYFNGVLIKWRGSAC